MYSSPAARDLPCFFVFLFLFLFCFFCLAESVELHNVTLSDTDLYLGVDDLCFVLICSDKGSRARSTVTLSRTTRSGPVSCYESEQIVSGIVSIATPIAIDQIRPIRVTESDSGLGPFTYLKSTDSPLWSAVPTVIVLPPTRSPPGG